MEQTKKHGGVRQGAGRPKGSGNKLTAQDLIDTAQQVIGKPFVVSLMEGYKKSIDENNNKVRVTYEKLIVDKVLADRQQIEVTESADAVQARAEAFAEALTTLASKGTK
jgi:hypothetical protein